MGPSWPRTDEYLDRAWLCPICAAIDFILTRDLLKEVNAWYWRVNQSRMSHDVFISHARKDKGIADAICEKLESAELRCWIADRDISAGEDWTEVTRKAIASSRVMVLVLSENANAAPHIEREIAHAFYTGRKIIPLRVTDTLPRRDFLFYLGNVHCFDASRPPAEQHLEAFAASVNGMMSGPAATGKSVPSLRPIDEAERLNFSDSWLGSLHASHYRTLELLKRGAVVIGVVAPKARCFRRIQR